MPQNIERKAVRISKNIRNRIGRLNGEDLLKNLILKLNRSDATSLDRIKKYEIWHLLLLVKWTIIYGDFSNLKRYDPVSEYQVAELLNRLKVLSEYAREINDMQDAEMFFRNAAYQQNWVQRTESIPIGFSHQLMLFGDLDPNHPHCKTFRHITNVSIKDFIELSCFLWSLVIDGKKHLVTKDSFSPLQTEIGPNEIVAFLDSISSTVDSSRKWLQQHSKFYESISAEYFEQSPLMRYPLIKHDNNYFVIADILLQTSLSTFVTDFLRAHDTQWFMRRFGSMYEELLNYSLSSIGVDFLTENDLVQHFGHRSGRKFVDFVVSDKGCNIFIEAKGVSLRWDVMVTDLPEKIAERSETSIEKGIRQAYNLAANLLPGTTIGGFEVGHGENYLLIVTFKDTYLGNAQYYYNHIDSEVIDEIIANHGKGELIPLAHIFFISVDELEIILGQIAHGPKTFSEWLASAVELGKNVKRVPIFRALVTKDNGDIKITPYLQQATEDLFERVIAKINQ